jgi:hypothetical protein
LNGYAPALAVEFGRKVLFSTERPTFIELENHVKKRPAKLEAVKQAPVTQEPVKQEQAA